LLCYRWKSSSGDGSILNINGKTDRTEAPLTGVVSSESAAKRNELVVRDGDEPRPSSVVDKRVDVTGSRDGLNIEEDIIYMNSDYDIDEDTESELNESANSRTLIWPYRAAHSALPEPHSTGKVFSRSAPVSAWDVTSNPQSAKDKSSPSSLREAGDLLGLIYKDGGGPSHVNDFDECSAVTHPHTPTPPPDEEPQILSHSSTMNDSKDSDSDETIVNKSELKRVSMGSFPSKNVTTLARQMRPQSFAFGGGDRSLLADPSSVGVSNRGYESPSDVARNKPSIGLNGTGHNNKVYPNKKLVDKGIGAKPLDSSSDSLSYEVGRDDAFAWCDSWPPKGDEKSDVRKTRQGKVASHAASSSQRARSVAFGRSLLGR